MYSVIFEVSYNSCSVEYGDCRDHVTTIPSFKFSYQLLNSPIFPVSLISSNNKSISNILWPSLSAFLSLSCFSLNFIYLIIQIYLYNYKQELKNFQRKSYYINNITMTIRKLQLH